MGVSSKRGLASFAAIAVCGLVSVQNWLAQAPANSQGWREHVECLAHDERGGREPGTDGHLESARYVASEFERLGVEPPTGSRFLQPVPLLS